MALDFRKGVYRPHRPDTRLKTTYGVMSEWQRFGRSRQYRVGQQPVSLMPRSFPGYAQLKRRPSTSGYQHQRQQHELSDIDFHPWSMPLDIHSAARAAALDETIPMHARFASGCGYDAFHNAYLAVKRHGPPQDFPIFGPPRLRHGRAGGSWRHIKEVMQAGGRRLVFVDGEISTNDTLQIDEVPGGTLILPSHAGPNFKGHAAFLDPVTSEKLLQHFGSQSRHRAVTVQKGLEKDNWAIIR